MRKPTLVDEIMNEEWNYGGIITPLWAIYKDLDEKGFSIRDRDWYIFCLTEHQRKEGHP